MRTLVDMQASFAAGELSPELHARVDLDKFAVGLKTCRNFFVHPHGGASNRPGTQFVGEAKATTAVRAIDFAFNTEQTYALEFGHLYMRVMKDGEHVVETAKTVTALSAASPPVLTSAAHGYSNGDDVYLDDITGSPGGPYRVANVAANTFELQDFHGNNIDGTGWALGTSPTASRVYTLTTPYAAADLFDLVYTQSADVMTIVHPSYAPRELTRTGHAAWTLTTITFGAGISAPTGLSATPTGAGAITYRYKVTAVSEETGEESLASSSASATNGTLSDTQYNSLSWTAVSGAEFYNVYKQRGGVYGFIGSADSNSFTDTGILADMVDTPPRSKNPFNATDKYPACVTYYQQRLAFGQTNEKPQTIWMSQSAAYHNFNVRSPVQDDDAVTFTIAARQVNEIRHLVPLQQLLVFTSGGEWLVQGSNSEVITPASINVKPQGYRGASQVAPLVVGDTVLYVEPNGAKVRDFAYRFESDAYNGNDLSILAGHLLEGYAVVDWAYQQHPHSIVWVVRSDGVLLGLTYLREHDVWAWHRHDTAGGIFESVCAIREGADDVLYAVVRRTIDSVERRYLERLAPAAWTAVEDAYYVDCGLTYDGAAVNELTGLDWLEGKTVAILADGNVQPQQVVTGGRITLAGEYSTIHVGLPIEADLESLPIDPRGSLGAKKTITDLHVRVVDTRGLQLGPDEDNLVDSKQQITQYDTPIALFTGDLKAHIASRWQDHAGVFIRQPHPLPANILAILPKVAAGV